MSLKISSVLDPSVHRNLSSSVLRSAYCPQPSYGLFLSYRGKQREIDVACTISVNARAAKQSGINVAWTVPREGCKVDTDGLWVPKGLPKNEEYWAKQFVNFSLTKEAQQKWCSLLGLPPVYPGIEPPADLVGDVSYTTKPEAFKKLLRIPSKVLVENQPKWFAKFNEIFQG